MTVHFSELEDKYWIRDGEEVRWFESSLDAKQALREIEMRDAVDAATAPLMVQINALSDALAWATAEIARMKEEQDG